MMRSWAKSTVLAVLLTSPAMAQQGDAVERVEALAGEARALYDAGDYGKSVAVYLEAYKLQPTAAVLYNVAVIYDKKLKEEDLAIDFYRRYIGSPDADPAAIQRATVRVQELKAQKEARRQADLSTLGDTPAEPTEPKPPAPLPAMSGQSVGGYVLLGIGATALIGYGVVGYLASDAADDFKSSFELDEKKDFRETAKSRALIADVMLGVGAAATIGGLLMVVLDDGDAPDTNAGLRVGPTTNGGVGMSWGGTF